MLSKKKKKILNPNWSMWNTLALSVLRNVSIAKENMKPYSEIDGSRGSDGDADFL